LNHLPDRLIFRLALIGAMVVSFSLTGCGRKGPLDPPPAASVASTPGASAAGAPPDGSAPPARHDKRIFLDNLLN
jgi:predicted small lipoprotein YifL